MEIVQAPLGTAVSIADFKSSIHIRLEDVDDDANFEALLLEAEDVVTRATGRILSPQQVAFTIPTHTLAPGCSWWVPVLPVVELVSLEASFQGSDWENVGRAGTWIMRGNDAAQLVLGSDWLGWSAPADTFRVVVQVGAASSRFPSLQRAIKLLVKEWFEASIAIEDVPRAQLSMGVTRLIRQVRYRRPCVVTFN